jgi:hypothetical protein
MPAPDAVKRLVDHFDQDHKVFLSSDYKEEQLRAEFLNSFFTALRSSKEHAFVTIRARNWRSDILFLWMQIEQTGRTPFPKWR